MEKLLALRQQKGELFNENEALKKGANITDADLDKMEANLKAIVSIDRQIGILETQEEIASKNVARAAAGGTLQDISKDEKSLQKNFSISKAFSERYAQKELTGAEAEMHQEAQREAKQLGLTLEGNVAIASKFIQFGAKRDLTIATEGTDVKPTNFGDVIPLLRPEPIIASLGARFVTNLSGDVKFPRQSAAATMAWEGETDANAETTPTFDNVTLAPNRVGGFIDVSKKFMLQSSFPVDAWIRAELEKAYALEIDSTAIKGLGSGNQPTGILVVSGIGAVALGTNGDVPTWASVVNLTREVDIDDALMGKLAYLGNPNVTAKLKTTEKASSTGIYLMGEAGQTLAGYPYYQTTKVPNDLTKAGGSALSALLFGNWDDLMIGQWGGVDMLVDQYTQATNGMVRVVFNSWLDMQVRHAQSFAAIQDMVTT